MTCLTCTHGRCFSSSQRETRRLVLDELSARDGQTLFEICSVLTMRHGLNLTRQAISQHLGVLESAGLVVTDRSGRFKFHYFNPDPLAEITGRWPTRKRTEPTWCWGTPSAQPSP
jgi:DNA-binding transcriptional ArsR family regulator